MLKNHNNTKSDKNELHTWQKEVENVEIMLTKLKLNIGTLNNVPVLQELVMNTMHQK